jgi:hypothetical protein
MGSRRRGVTATSAEGTDFPEAIGETGKPARPTRAGDSVGSGLVMSARALLTKSARPSSMPRRKAKSTPTWWRSRGQSSNDDQARSNPRASVTVIRTRDASWSRRDKRTGDNASCDRRTAQGHQSDGSLERSSRRTEPKGAVSRPTRANAVPDRRQRVLLPVSGSCGKADVAERAPASTVPEGAEESRARPAPSLIETFEAFPRAGRHYPA